MKKATILILDDEPGHRRILSDILSARGYDTVVAADGADGLALLGSGGVDVALIDLELPVIPGLEVLDRLKSRYPAVEAIVLTGHAGLDSAIEATNKGAFAYLQKPYELDHLLLHIRRALEKQRMETALLESENRFRTLTEKSLVGIYLVQDDLFQYVNPMLAGIFGYAVDDLIGKKGPNDLTLSEDWPIVRDHLRKRLSGEVESAHYHFRGRKRNGDVVYLEVFGSSIVHQGRPAVIGSLLDVTDRRRLEEERETLISRLQDSLAKIRTLSGMLPICSYCKKIRDDKGYWSRLEEYLSEHSEAKLSHGLCPECEKRAKAAWKKAP